MISSILYYYFMRDEEDKPIENDEKPKILGIDLSKEEEDENGLDNNQTAEW